MKRQHIIEVLIWLLLLVLVSLALVFAHYFFFVKKHTHTLAFSDVDGIIKGSPVRFSGVVVGHVRNIRIQNSKVLVEIIITQPKVTIPDNSTARVEFSGLGGSKSIEIAPPTGDISCNYGIIVANPVRLKDFVDSLEVYSNVLVALENGLVKLSSDNTMELLTKISARYDFGPFDRAFDSALDLTKSVNNMTSNIKNAEETVNNWLDAVPVLKK